MLLVDRAAATACSGIPRRVMTRLRRLARTVRRTDASSGGRADSTTTADEFGTHGIASVDSKDVAPALSIDDFRRRYARGELSLARWTECCIEPSDVEGLDGDPRSPAYAEAVRTTWSRITGRDEYDAEVDETFELDDADYLAHPYPYSSRNPDEVSNYLGAVAAAVGRIGVPPPARIVEYGSGWGHLALALASTGYDVTAVDLNPASVELLRRRAAALGVALDVRQCGFLDFVADSPVDVIVFFESFHHCERPFDLLDRCRDLLAGSGRIVFLAEAIYDGFYAPWGVRLDGSAAFMAAQQGWLELGFRRDFFTAELTSRGFDVSWEVVPSLGAYGTVMLADVRPAEE